MSILRSGGMLRGMRLCLRKCDDLVVSERPCVDDMEVISRLDVSVSVGSGGNA